MWIVNTLLIVWPLIPPAIVAIALPALHSESNTVLKWAVGLGLLVWVYGAPWFLFGVLTGVTVLVIRPRARLTRSYVKIPAVSIGLNAVGMALYWLGIHWGAWLH